MQPLVSVICLCYNHARFLEEALQSVLAQTYKNIEIIVVDDFSTDNSASIIDRFCEKHPKITFIRNEKNYGNCRSFNTAWRQSKGDFIIDFATDDVMQPERVMEQVQALQQAGPQYGVCYTDAVLIDEQSRQVGYHYKRIKKGELLSFAPSGDVFAEVLRRYFINPPSMLMRREVFEKLNGYDETMAYEDFD
ncbi:MAG: glycosyltransferase family 2 protein, partial [Hymenobacteraceae bacterium]|nr:glycosyltransferase family 2 protein [Hymenobacteraceae bacterium]